MARDNAIIKAIAENVKGIHALTNGLAYPKPTGMRITKRGKGLWLDIGYVDALGKYTHSLTSISADNEAELYIYVHEVCKNLETV